MLKITYSSYTSGLLRVSLVLLCRFLKLSVIAFEQLQLANITVYYAQNYF